MADCTWCFRSFDRVSKRDSRPLTISTQTWIIEVKVPFKRILQCLTNHIQGLEKGGGYARARQSFCGRHCQPAKGPVNHVFTLQAHEYIQNKTKHLKHLGRCFLFITLAYTTVLKF